jgi:CRISPR/Cas system CSM-associated protein Csm3 (group 7 of RAMP superfamily)
MAEGIYQQLAQVVHIPMTYHTNGALAVRTGLGDGVRDNLVMREGGDGSRPIIPGSTLKGVTRHLLESILAQVMPNQICVPLVVAPSGGVAGRKVPCDHRDYRGPICLICQLFGNTRLRSRITFHDAKIDAPPEEQTTFTRTHVAIDRRTGTQYQQMLMSSEVVPGNAMQFKGAVTLLNPEAWMVGAVTEMSPLLTYYGVGGMKSRGYGDLQVHVGLPVFVVRLTQDEQTPEVYQAACVTAWQAMRASLELTRPAQE